MAAQENPLAVLEGFKLYELVKYVSMTNHMWSGFNLMAHLPTWQRLPDDIRGAIERNVVTHVRRQRGGPGALNAALRQDLERRGLLFNEVDPAPFRARLGGRLCRLAGAAGPALLVAAGSRGRPRSLTLFRIGRGLRLRGGSRTLRLDHGSTLPP